MFNASKSLAAAMALAAWSLPSQAAVILQDVGQFDASIAAFDPIGQSFVAQDRFLSSIAFAYSDINPSFANEPVTMTLYQGSGFGGPVVSSVTQTLPGVLPGTLAPPQFIDFDFSGTSLTVGQTYTAGVTVPTSPKVAVVYAGTDAYAGGQLFESSPTSNLSGCPACDLNFRVTPSAMALPTTSVTPGPIAGLPPTFVPTLTWVFNDPRPRQWFDPPLAEGFHYELVGGGTLTGVKGVPGFAGLDVVVNGVVLDTSLDPGETFLFGPGVTSFSLLGINPLVDAADPTAFPTFLDFSGSPTQLRMSALMSAPTGTVSEPGTLALLGGCAALALWRRRRA